MKKLLTSCRRWKILKKIWPAQNPWTALSAEMWDLEKRKLLCAAPLWPRPTDTSAPSSAPPPFWQSSILIISKHVWQTCLFALPCSHACKAPMNRKKSSKKLSKEKLTLLLAPIDNFFDDFFLFI